MNIEKQDSILYIDVRSSKYYQAKFTFEKGCEEIKELCRKTDVSLKIIFRSISENTKSQILQVSNYVVDGYRENMHKEDITFILFVDKMFFYIDDEINRRMAIERNKTKTFEEKFLKALKKKPENLQTKDKKLEIIEFLEDPKYNCEYKTNSLIAKDIKNLVQKMKDDLASEEKDEIYITCDDEVMTLTRFVKDNLYWDGQDARSEANSLYRTKEFEKCKLGAAYDMIALHLKESDIRSHFLRGFDKIKVREFQNDFTHLYLFFTTHLMNINFDISEF